MAFELFLILALVLLLSGMPIAFAMLTSALLYTVLNSGDLSLMVATMFGSLNSFILIAIPLFVLAAEVMNETTITDRIFNFANAIVGWARGGLAHVNVVASVIFAGTSGSEAADVGGVGKVEFQAMTKRGYDPPFSAALTAASSCIGPIIPPSIPMIVYGTVANVSVVSLFLGGILPGAVMTLAMMAYIAVVAKKKGLPREAPQPLRVIAQTLVRGFFPLLTPLILLGGISSGVVTVTEAAMLAGAYTLLLGGLLFRALSLKGFVGALKRVVITSGAILWLFPAADAFGHILVTERLPEVFANLLSGISDSKILVLLLVNAFFLVLGMFSSALINIILFVPVVLPLLESLGVHPIHFGVVIVFNVVLGVLTPPLGSGVFFTSAVTKVPSEKIFKEVVPFVAIFIVILLLMTFVPQFVLLVPTLLGG